MNWALRGDEHVLDVGCGRGAVPMLAARRVPAGRAVERTHGAAATSPRCWHLLDGC
jgi:cyclopropane fatty-acyl-phospholipid synthase-like methyltransferase